VLLYDGRCRFCRFAARTVVRLDREQRLAFLPLDDPEGMTLLAGLSDDERTGSIHLVEPGGARYARGAALARLIRHLGVPAPFGLLGLAYEPVARNRGRFGRRVPDGGAPRRYP